MGGFIKPAAHRPPPRQAEDEFFMEFCWSAGGRAWGRLPLCFASSNCSLFLPVGYYFLTHFDNYFINQER